MDAPLRGARDVRGQSKPPSLQGGFVVDTVRGTLRIRRWPRPRGSNQPPQSREWVNFLKFCSASWNVLPVKFRMAAERDSKNRPWMPRDLWVASLAGRMWAINTWSNGTIYPYVAMTDVSDSLDILAQFPGMMLRRGAQLWEPIPVGSAGQVLTLTGDPLMPEWVDPPATGLDLSDQWAPAGSWAPSGSFPQHVAAVTAAAGWQLRDGQTDTLYATISLPPDTSAVVVIPHILGDLSASGDIRLRVQARPAVPGDAIGSVAAQQWVVTIPSGTRVIAAAPPANLTLSSPAPMMTVEVARIGAHTSDTLSATVYLLGARVVVP